MFCPHSFTGGNMHVTGYDFSKKDNSTKRPNSGQIANWTGNIKTESGILHPSIEIVSPANSVSQVNPYSVNYLYISEFNRYYFVREWRYERGLWVCDADVDVLATYKPVIERANMYVLRYADDTVYNPYIVDTMYPATTDTALYTWEFPETNTFASTISGGTFVLGVISGASAGIGAITYYAMSSSTIKSLCDKLFTDDNLEIMGILQNGIQVVQEDLSKEVLKTLYNPFQYIASCMWFPIPTSSFSGVTETVELGWWDYTTISALRITESYIHRYHTSAVTVDHPQSLTRGAYLNFAPYTEFTLHGKFGSMALNPIYFTDSNNFTIDYEVDVISGNCKVIIRTTYGGNSVILGSRHYQMGVTIQLAQVGVDYLGGAVSALNGASQAMNTPLNVFNPVGTAANFVATTASGIYNYLAVTQPQVETSGANGCFSNAFVPTYLTAVYHLIVDEDLDHKGRPLCENRTLGQLTGYVLCADGDIDISCFEEERTKIGQYLTSGFFME